MTLLLFYAALPMLKSAVFVRELSAIETQCNEIEAKKWK